MINKFKIQVLIYVLIINILCSCSAFKSNNFDTNANASYTFVLDDKYGRSHIYDKDFNEIMTYDTETESYNVGVDDKEPIICIRHKLIEYGMSRFIFYDMKGNKLDFEVELENASYQYSTLNYYIFKNAKGYVRVNKLTKEVEQIKELNEYNYFEKFGAFYVFSITGEGNVWGEAVLCDENLNFIKSLEGYHDNSCYINTIVDVCGNKYLKLFADGYTLKKGGNNLLDTNGNLLFDEPYEVINDNYNRSTIELKDGKYKVLFDINKRQIINKDEIINIKEEERRIIDEIEKKNNIKIVEINFAENNKDLIIARLEDGTDNIYNRDLELLFEDVGNIKYFELNGMKLSSNNKKTVVIDDNYNIIKSLDEDYNELESNIYNGQMLIIGTYSVRQSQYTYRQAFKFLDTDLNVVEVYGVLLNDVTSRHRDDWDLMNYGMFVVGQNDANLPKYNFNDLVIYDFDYNVVKKFDSKYYAQDIALLDINHKKYYLTIVDGGLSDLYDDEFNIILSGISYIDASFLKNGVLVCINGDIYRYSKDFKSKELILKDVSNFNAWGNSIRTDYKCGDLIFVKQNDKWGAIDKTGEVVLSEYDRLDYQSVYAGYYEKGDRKGYIRYSDKKEISVEKLVSKKETELVSGEDIKQDDRDINYKILKDDLKKGKVLIGRYGGYPHDEIMKSPTFQFGMYEQDNNNKNGKENIEWILIRRVDNKVLLISKYVLDCKCYDENSEDYNHLTWESCSLRKWLNEEFFNEAFNYNEKMMMHKYYNDYVTILDREETEQLLGGELNYSNGSLMAQATEYAVKVDNYNSHLNAYDQNLKSIFGDDYDVSYTFCEYWVRQDDGEGLAKKEACVIDVSGRLKDGFVPPNYKSSGIRPVICIDLEE